LRVVRCTSSSGLLLGEVLIVERAGEKHVECTEEGAIHEEGRLVRCTFSSALHLCEVLIVERAGEKHVECTEEGAIHEEGRMQSTKSALRKYYKEGLLSTTLLFIILSILCALAVQALLRQFTEADEDDAQQRILQEKRMKMMRSSASYKRGG
jgi:hypothetical protein